MVEELAVVEYDKRTDLILLLYLLLQLIAYAQMGLCFSKYETTGEGSENQLELSGGNIHLITAKDVWEQKLAEAKSDNKIVIANFSASWCGPCRTIAPYYREMSEKHPSLMFLTIDVDELAEFSSQWDIKATPTFFFLKDGEQFDKLVGANQPELEKKIASAGDSVAPT